jgi:D-arginine utilization repressor
VASDVSGDLAPPQEWAEPYATVAEAVVRLFYPHVEAVIHDIKQDVVVRIWNPISGRRPGDPSLLDASLLGELSNGRGSGGAVPKGAPGPTWSNSVAGPYPQAGLRGAEISSVSAVIAGGRGLLCLNFDRSVLSQAAESLRTFALSLEPRPAGLFDRDWREDLNAVVHAWCAERGLRAVQLSREDRGRLVSYLDGRGAFQVRRAASHLAEILGVSRATVYASLQAARSDSHDVG